MAMCVMSVTVHNVYQPLYTDLLEVPHFQAVARILSGSPSARHTGHSFTVEANAATPEHVQPSSTAILSPSCNTGQRCQVVCLQGFSAFDAASTVAAMYATVDVLQVAGPKRMLDDTVPPPRSGTLASLLQAEPWVEPQTGRLAPGAAHHDSVATDQLQQASPAVGRQPQLAPVTGGGGADQPHQSDAGVRGEGSGMAALLAASAPGAASGSGDADAALQLAQLPSCFSQGAGWGVSAGSAADARGRTSSDTAGSVADCGGSCSASSGNGGARSCSSREYSRRTFSVDTPCLCELPQGVCRPLRLARRHKSLRHRTELADLRQRRGSLTALYAPLLSALSCPAAALPFTKLASSPVRHSLPVCRHAGRAGRHASLHGHSPVQLVATAVQAAQAEADRGPETTAGTAGVWSMRASDEWQAASLNQSPREGLELPPDERRRLGLGQWSAPMHEGAWVQASFVQPCALVDGWKGDAAAERAAQVDSVASSGRGRGGDRGVAGASAEEGRAGHSPPAAPPQDQKAEKLLLQRLVSWSVRAVRLLFV